MTLDVAVLRQAQGTRVAIEGTPTVGQLMSLLTVMQIDAEGWPRGGVWLDLAGVQTALDAPARCKVEDQARRCLGTAGPVRVHWSSS